MSVYPRGKTGVYWYDFWLQGHRFLGSTGTTTKRDAERFEAEVRKRVRLELATSKTTLNAPITFDAALGKFWDEVGTHYTGTYRTTVFTALDWLLNRSGIGATTLLRDITVSHVSEAIARRRGQDVSNA